MSGPFIRERRGSGPAKTKAKAQPMLTRKKPFFLYLESTDEPRNEDRGPVVPFQFTQLVGISIVYYKIFDSIF